MQKNFLDLACTLKKAYELNKPAQKAPKSLCIVDVAN